jgi:hypothetical protein
MSLSVNPICCADTTAVIFRLAGPCSGMQKYRLLSGLPGGFMAELEAMYQTQFVPNLGPAVTLSTATF